MKYRWKTIGGLLLIAALGGSAAQLFQRRPTTSPTTAASAASEATALGSSPRGRIVPLLVNDDAAIPAFVAAAPSTNSSSLTETWNRVDSLPTIRASAAANAIAAPEMSPLFPRPRDLVAADLAEPSSSTPLAAATPSQVSSLAPESDANTTRSDPISFAPIAPPTIAAKPIVPIAVRHVVIDGDTLPALAERYLGDATRAQEIFAANASVLSSPDVLPIGAVLTIEANP